MRPAAAISDASGLWPTVIRSTIFTAPNVKTAADLKGGMVGISRHISCCKPTLPGFNFNVEEWDAEWLRYETLAICRSLTLVPLRQHYCALHANMFLVRRADAVMEQHVTVLPLSNPAYRHRNRTRVVKRHPEGDW
jgi:hypothetical protein